MSSSNGPQNYYSGQRYVNNQEPDAPYDAPQAMNYNNPNASHAPTTPGRGQPGPYYGNQSGRPREGRPSQPQTYPQQPQQPQYHQQQPQYHQQQPQYHQQQPQYHQQQPQQPQQPQRYGRSSSRPRRNDDYAHPDGNYVPRTDGFDQNQQQRQHQQHYQPQQYAQQPPQSFQQGSHQNTVPRQDFVPRQSLAPPHNQRQNLTQAPRQSQPPRQSQNPPYQQQVPYQQLQQQQQPQPRPSGRAQGMIQGRAPASKSQPDLSTGMGSLSLEPRPAQNAYQQQPQQRLSGNEYLSEPAAPAPNNNIQAPNTTHQPVPMQSQTNNQYLGYSNTNQGQEPPVRSLREPDTYRNDHAVRADDVKGNQLPVQQREQPPVRKYSQPNLNDEQYYNTPSEPNNGQYGREDYYTEQSPVRPVNNKNSNNFYIQKNTSESNPRVRQYNNNYATPAYPTEPVYSDNRVPYVPETYDKVDNDFDFTPDHSPERRPHSLSPSKKTAELSNPYLNENEQKGTIFHNLPADSSKFEPRTNQPVRTSAEDRHPINNNQTADPEFQRQQYQQGYPATDHQEGRKSAASGRHHPQLQGQPPQDRASEHYTPDYQQSNPYTSSARNSQSNNSPKDANFPPNRNAAQQQSSIQPQPAWQQNQPYRSESPRQHQPPQGNIYKEVPEDHMRIPGSPIQPVYQPVQQGFGKKLVQPPLLKNQSSSGSLGSNNRGVSPAHGYSQHRNGSGGGTQPQLGAGLSGQPGLPNNNQANELQMPRSGPNPDIQPLRVGKQSGPPMPSQPSQVPARQQPQQQPQQQPLPLAQGFAPSPQKSLGAHPPPMRQYDNSVNAVNKAKSTGVDLSDLPPMQAPPGLTIEKFETMKRNHKAQPNKPETDLEFAKSLVEAAAKFSDRYMSNGQLMKGPTAKTGSTNDDSSNARVDAKVAKKNRENWTIQAHKIVKKLSSNNYTPAMFYLASNYGSGGLGLESDHEKAFDIYNKAAKLNHPQSCYRLAVCYEVGAGVKKDTAKAITWYQKAASLNDVSAMYKLGMVKLNGLLDQQKSAAEGVTWLKRAAAIADADNPHSLHELGLLYERADKLFDSQTLSTTLSSIIEKDEKKAFDLFLKAAKFNYPPSQFRLGCCYEYGTLGCSFDPKRSIAWYSRAAERGEPESELALSGWYLTGSEGILQQSDTEAYLWARKAAEKGLVKAEYALGYYSEAGIGGKKDLVEAKKWYYKAAAQKHPKAISRLREFNSGK